MLGTELEPQQQFDTSNKLIKSLKQHNFTPDLVNGGKALPNEETLLLASCNYETNTKWGQERVRRIIPPHYLMHCDKDGLTANDVLEMEHQDMYKEAKCWIKETAQSCSTVAVLVATVVFAAACTIPGGSENGTPVGDVPFNPNIAIQAMEFLQVPPKKTQSGICTVVLLIGVHNAGIQRNRFADDSVGEHKMDFCFVLFNGEHVEVLEMLYLLNLCFPTVFFFMHARLLPWQAVCRVSPLSMATSHPLSENAQRALSQHG
ncbi:uncharacterized protein DS421_3g81300 [Arachis hypogaea]|nr:uncharacterized protein DS421_3g81300 [Arachis hypogaea]